MRRWVGVVALCLAGYAFVTSGTGSAQDAPGGGPSSVRISDEGQQVYEQICQACHMADAKGGGGAGAVIPALAGNDNLADPKFMMNVVIRGRGGMPWFTDMLTPAQIAAVVNYVRHHFNAYPETVTEADIVGMIAAKGTQQKAECNTCG